METTTTPSVRTEIIDPSIESADPENCTMSILFEKDGLVFSILRNDLQKFIVLGDYQIPKKSEQTQALFSFRERLDGQFEKTQIGFFTPKLAILPAPLFDAAHVNDYANFQFKLEADEHLRVDELKEYGLVLIYAVPKAVNQAVEYYFPGLILKHAGAFSIAYYQNLYKNKPGQHMHVNVWNGHLEATALSNGKVLLYNTFQFETDEDLLYFILNIYEQLEFNPETVPLKVAGELSKIDARWQMLHKYIRFVETESRPANCHYSHEFNGLSQHMYNRVFQAATCEL